ncbi:hypothetical protein G6F50_016778 [Rhizopus delemar]|uniref:Uncharacterized protein n=1 Tax=Rhizopus delemar TaxID=936053 RepID=A0A9P7C159_9FUNG|nr:hypothetical protein G6F50_016778 [Rhizopus delemar]
MGELIRRQAARREAQRIGVLAVQFLAAAVFFQDRIQRLFAAVGPDADLRAGGARQVGVLQLATGAEQRIGLAAERGTVLVDVVLRRVHAFLQGAAQGGIQGVGLVGLARFQADAGEAKASWL